MTICWHIRSHRRLLLQGRGCLLGLERRLWLLMHRLLGAWYWLASPLLAAFLLLPSLRIGLLPLLLFSIFLKTSLDVGFKLSAFSGWKLIQLELKDITLVVLWNTLLHNLYNAILLWLGQHRDWVFQLGLFLQSHRYILHVGFGADCGLVLDLKSGLLSGLYFTRPLLLHGALL
jgi:hypothetical protein